MVVFITAASHLGARTRGEEAGEWEREGPRVYHHSQFLIDVLKTRKQLHTEKEKGDKKQIDRWQKWSHLYLGDQFLQNWSVKAKQI